MATAAKHLVNLKPFLLNDAPSNGMGRRPLIDPFTFGGAEHLLVGGRICSGRKLNARLGDSQYVPIVTNKLVHVCTLLTKLRHENIVRFLGLSYQDGSLFPQVVSEYVPYNLALLLEEVDDIPLVVKRSILCDVAKGLDYLHGQRPAVVHRCLTAYNILLNSAMTAKIADIGITEVESLLDGHQISMVS